MDLSYIVGIGAKIALKVGMNVICPGSGSTVDFVEGVRDCRNGDYGNAAMNFGTVALDAFLLGFWSGSKDIAKELGKAAAINVAKTEATEASKYFGKEAGKILTKQIGRNLGKEFGKGMVEETVDRAMYDVIKRSTRDIFLKGSIIGLVEGGGTDVIKKTIFTNILHGTLEEGVKTVPKAVIGSMTASAAESAAQKYFLETSKHVFKINTVKTIANAVIKLQNVK